MNKWKINTKGIIRSVESVLKTGDIDKLTQDAYGFVMNMSGFIAHYDINGFKSEYNNTADLLRELQKSVDVSDAERYINDSWFSNNEQSEYYASKTEILVAIRGMCKKYAVSCQDSENESVIDKFDLLKTAVNKCDDVVSQKQLLKTLGIAL